MITCPRCGAQGNQGKFCTNCGAALAPAQAPNPVPYAPPARPNLVVWWAAGAVGTVVIAGVVALVALGLNGGGGTDTVDIPTSTIDKAPASTATKGASSAAVGSWRCMSYAGTFCPVGWDLKIKANGTYEMGAEKGNWKMLDATHIKMEGGFLGKWSAGQIATVSGGPHVSFTITIDGVEMPVDYAKVDE